MLDASELGTKQGLLITVRGCFRDRARLVLLAARSASDRQKPTDTVSEERAVGHRSRVKKRGGEYARSKRDPVGMGRGHGGDSEGGI